MVRPEYCVAPVVFVVHQPATFKPCERFDIPQVCSILTFATGVHVDVRERFFDDASIALDHRLEFKEERPRGVRRVPAFKNETSNPGDVRIGSGTLMPPRDPGQDNGSVTRRVGEPSGMVPGVRLL